MNISIKSLTKSTHVSNLSGKVVYYQDYDIHNVESKNSNDFQPFVDIVYFKMFQVVIEHDNYCMNIFFGSKWESQLRFIEIGDKLEINAPYTVVVDDIDSNQIALTKLPGIQWIKYCLALDDHIQSQAFRVTVKRFGRTLRNVNNSTVGLINLEDEDIKKQIPISKPETPINSPIRSPTKLVATSDKYTYISLSDIKSTRANYYYNYSVVIGYSQAKINGPSAKDKHMVTYLLIDQLRNDFNNPTQLNVFSNYSTNYPPIYRIGDILRLHRVSSQFHQGSIQLYGNIDYSDRLVLVSFHNKLIDPFTGILSNQAINNNNSSNSKSSTSFAGLSGEKWQVNVSKDRDFSFDPIHNQLIEDLDEFSQIELFNKPLSIDNQTNDYQSNYIDFYNLLQYRINISNLSAIKRCDTIGIITYISDFNHLVDGQLHYIHVCDGSIHSDDEINYNDNLDIVSTAWLSSYLYSQCNSFNELSDKYNDIINYLTTINHKSSSKHKDSIYKAFGQSIRIQVVDNVELLNNLRVGMWIRLRNLYLDYLDLNSYDVINDLSSVPLATIYHDTHVCTLLPYYRDPINITKKYYTANTPMYSEPVVKPVRKLLSDKGDPYTPLALCLTTVAPAKFCVLATIVDYFPKDINRFIVLDGKIEECLLFSLKIADDTATSDVIIGNEDAETFLNLTIDEVIHNTNNCHDKIKIRLNTLIESSKPLDFYIKSYHTKNNDKVIGNKKRGRSKISKSSNDSNNQSNKNVKRFRVFNTKLFPDE